MICFKDKTFCGAKCSNKECGLNWEMLDKSDYRKWSENFSGGGPVALSDFSPNCEDYEQTRLSP